MGRPAAEPYADVCRITQAYEKAALNSCAETMSDRGAQIFVLGSLATMKEMIDFHRKSIERFGNHFKKEIQAASKQNTKTSLDSTEDDCAIDPELARSAAGQPEEQIRATDPPIIIDPVDAVVRDNRDVQEWLGLTDQEMKEEVEKCIKCDLKAKIKLQIQMPNLLLEIDGFIDDIMDIVAMFKERLDPKNMHARWCEFLDLFADIGWCLTDWITLLIALKLALRKWIMQGLSITLDWTLIIGPLLKFILDLLEQLIQQLMMIIAAPFDCVLNLLETINELYKATVDLVNNTAAAAQSLTDFSKDDDGTQNFGPFGGWKTAPGGAVGWNGGKLQALNPFGPGNSSGGNSSGQGLDISIGKGGITAEGSGGGGGPKGFGDLKIPGFTSTDSSSGGSGGGGTAGGGKTLGLGGAGLIPKGFKLKAQDNLEEKLKDPLIKWANPVEMLILVVRDAKQWVLSIFSNLLYAIKSLNAFLSMGFGINLNASGAIMMILDIIAFVIMLIKLKNIGCDTSKMGEDPQSVAGALREVYPDYQVDLDEGNPEYIKMTRGSYEVEMPLTGTDCATFIPSQDMAQLKGWLKSISNKGVK